MSDRYCPECQRYTGERRVQEMLINNKFVKQYFMRCSRCHVDYVTSDQLSINNYLLDAARKNEIN